MVRLKLNFKRLMLLFGLSFAISSSIAYATHEWASKDCTWRHGGIVAVCYMKAGDLPKGHIVPAGIYTSAGVMILHNASCIDKAAIFKFHGAHDTFTQEIKPDGNKAIYERLHGFPKLVAHLQDRGILESLDLVVINSDKMALLGVPICK